MWKALVVCVVLLVSGGHGATDLTLTDRATGSDVVDAVVDLIRQSGIFDDDRLLLRRIAYVETDDGTAGNTFLNNGSPFYGGIWQINQSDFQATLSSSLNNTYNDINTVFGIDWLSVQYSSLVKPLYSGLAARLKIDAYFKNASLTVPQSINDQASYWAQRYTFNTRGSIVNTTNYFITKVNSTESSCSSPSADIVFVLDSSGSILAHNFDKVRTFVVDVVGHFNVNQQQVRIGLIQFSDYAVTQFALTQYNSTSSVQDAVRKIPYLNSGTNSAAALLVLLSTFQRDGRQQDGVPITAIFMTDGLSNDRVATANAARYLHDNLTQLTVFSVGVGSSVVMSELEVIASQPSSWYVYLLSSFNDVTSFVTQITNQACRVPAAIEVSSNVTGSLRQNEFYYFKIPVFMEKNGVTVQIRTLSGGVKYYLSWKVRNPSSALFDFSGEVRDTQTNGISVFVPWNNATTNSSSIGRRKRSTDDVSRTVYGAIVGTQQKQNNFMLSYVDSAINDSTSRYADSTTNGYTSSHTDPITNGSTVRYMNSVTSTRTDGVLKVFLSMIVIFAHQQWH